MEKVDDWDQVPSFDADKAPRRSTSSLDDMGFVVATASIGLAFGRVLRFVGGGAPIGWCMVVALVVLPVIGLLVTLDDDLPGGWSNPDGKVRPPWLHWESWADLGSRGGISGIGFAVDYGWRTLPALGMWLLGAAGIAVSALIHRHIRRSIA